MVIVSFVEGDLLNANQKYIAQQCNCVTCLPHGLSKAISKKFNHGGLYEFRKREINNTAIAEDRDVSPNKIHPTIVNVFMKEASMFSEPRSNKLSIPSKKAAPAIIKKIRV